MNFRKDINGLRAIAVIAVVLFHFNSSWLSGGFAGVDVFFVISGFLMTGIIFKGIEQENFSLMRFYVARANRIIPALALLSFLLLVFGWFFLTPLDYKSLGKHVASSVGFLSNIIYWRESGYFDAASHEKWLLHTWSLSVEWQFYIIYPLALVAMRKFMSLKAMKTTVLVGTILGFIFCVIATYKWPDPAYYLLPTRAWEMMLGGVAYLYPMNLKDNRKKILEWFGLAFIFGSYIFISSSNPWPGYLAIIPVLGTFFIIQAQCNNSFITGNVLFQKIGAWSYSIYLWHWPIVVAIYYFSLNDTFIYIGIALSIYLGFLSHKYVEKIKFRNDFGNLFSYLKCRPIYIAFFIGIIGTLAYLTNGFGFHYSEYISSIAKQQEKPSKWKECERSFGIKPEKDCTYGEGDVAAIVIGDSHARHMLSMISSLYPNNKIIDWHFNACSVAVGLYQDRPKNKNQCNDFIEHSILKAKTEYPGIPIIIINRTSLYFSGQNEEERTVPATFAKGSTKLGVENTKKIAQAMIDTACQFSKYSPVYVVRPIPELKSNVPKELSKSFIITNEQTTISITYDEYIKRQELAYITQDKMHKQCGIKIINPIPYLCNNNKCIGNKEDTIYYVDDDHLSENGAQLISPAFKSALRE